MAQPPPDVEGDDCLPEYHHLFCPDLLQDKVAFITGGGSGIGFRIAEIFMRHGCHTVIVGRSLQKVTTAAKKLVAATGKRCLPLSMDVRVPPEVMTAVDQALQEFGKINILINCAAGNFLCPASALSFNAFKTVVDIDTIGTFNVSSVLYKKFFRDHGGVIVNITATLSMRGQVLQLHAGAAKAAVGGSNASSKLKHFSNPIPRLGTKTEIAHSVLYLASPLASYVSGIVLVVDGGSWMTFPNGIKQLLEFESFSAKL
ncbi:peroxisomal 2,4-dienoyl-CoA reductase [(3E)-enoyl-CoA-producing] isoform 6 [Mus musculus]|uniref:Peroxisomal 2,4-dienoyl-CoA reductase [(3E)-enoyl-CoA-producing] n=1 Tax=Mus musculus TaxID=10090 RepID=A0A494BB28_MOUSE|nr:peroxisomal 2,4-dienoyl-CoA reductase [(3E)-enoyl-CoA-producing] isoform 6 [Mus musculus]